MASLNLQVICMCTFTLINKPLFHINNVSTVGFLFKNNRFAHTHTQVHFQKKIVTLSTVLCRWTSALWKRKYIEERKTCNIESFYLDKIQLSICECWSQKTNTNCSYMSCTFIQRVVHFLRWVRSVEKIVRKSISRVRNEIKSRPALGRVFSLFITDVSKHFVTYTSLPAAEYVFRIWCEDFWSKKRKQSTESTARSFWTDNPS